VPLPVAMEVFSLNAELNQPDREPDLRAVIGSRGLLVVPWRADLQWAELHAGPIDPEEKKWFRIPKQHRAILEIWQVRNDYFARPLGEPRGADLVASLRAWAEQRDGGKLVLGRPLPDYGPEPLPLSLPRRSASRPPDFRFVFPDHGRETERIRVTPWGFTSDHLHRIKEPWHGAVGDVVAIDRDHAVAYFARVDLGLRGEAEAALKEWADKDGWNLRILEGTHPLIHTEKPPATHSGSSLCQDCGHSLGTGMASHMAFSSTGHKKTRCRICGGRYAWFEKAEGPAPVP
jgi:hypothetical protein